MNDDMSQRTKSDALDVSRPKNVSESMDFEEMESIMWRKVTLSYCIRLRLICCSASIKKIFSGPWSLVDQFSSYHCLEMGPCGSHRHLYWNHGIPCGHCDTSPDELQVQHM